MSARSHNDGKMPKNYLLVGLFASAVGAVISARWASGLIVFYMSGQYAVAIHPAVALAMLAVFFAAFAAICAFVYIVRLFED